MNGQSPPLRLFDTARGEVVPVEPGPTAQMYVCGITPYDATHMGHAATYVTFDVVARALLDSGHEVAYVQNVTDVDDPLLERATRDGIEWTDLAERETDLFREDMAALGVLPPTAFVGVVEAMDTVVDAVRGLVERGLTYRLDADDAPGADVYLDLAALPSFGSVSTWSREEMLAVYADRGGDPDRQGKRDALDPLLWRAARPGEPAWDGGVLGRGRPGWHVECTAIALDRLRVPIDIQGGGTDLVFPHHEMSAVQAVGLRPGTDFARCYVHQEMVGYEGEKISKSRGNLVLVSALRRDGVDPMAVRLVLLEQHYRTAWEWTAEGLCRAEKRLAAWREAFAADAGPDPSATLAAVRSAVADDLDTCAALEAVDAWVERAGRGRPGVEAQVAGAPATVAALVDGLLGVRV